MSTGGKRKYSTSRAMWSGWPYLIILIVSFLIGAFVGIAFSFFLDSGPELANQLSEYCLLYSKGETSASFLSVLWDCMRWPLLTVALGITVLGIVGIPVLFAVRGFLLSFSVCTFGLLLGPQGIAVAAVLFAVLILLVLPVLFVLGCTGLRVACMRLPSAIPSAGKQYRLEILLICVGVLAVSVAVQWTVVPSILSIVCSRLSI